tara:strand:+ start:532 stop:1062 length:531 start_codon:yes stop_codon:yes gene_type:complete
MSNIKTSKNQLYFFCLSLFVLFLVFISNNILNIDGLLINSLGDQVSNVQLYEVLELNKKWEWIGFMFIPVMLFLKIIVIAFIIDSGCFFFDKDIKYRKIFNIVVKAEFIFLLVIVFKTLWFYVFQQDYTLEDLQYFYPLSAINITGYQGLQPWFVYPLQVLNLFLRLLIGLFWLIY